MLKPSFKQCIWYIHFVMHVSHLQGIQKSSEMWFKIKSNHLPKIWFKSQSNRHFPQWFKIKIKSNRFTKWHIILVFLVRLSTCIIILKIFKTFSKKLIDFYGILLVFMLFIKCFVAMWKYDFKWFEIWFSWTFWKSNLKSNPHISIRF
jgi:hypothetical protein